VATHCSSAFGWLRKARGSGLLHPRDASFAVERPDASRPGGDAARSHLVDDAFCPNFRGMGRTLALYTILLALLTGCDVAQGDTRPAASVRAPAPFVSDTPPASARYAASARGSVYYPVTCDEWRRLAPANRIFFASSAEAENAGYARTTSGRCAAPPPPGASITETGTCTVVRIIDGDTLACTTGERVRLLLVDAPELDHEQFGVRARLALEELLPVGAAARVETDVQLRDRYGRVLAYLYTDDGVMVNEALARRGYVVVDVYPPNVRHVERLRAAVAVARAAEAGLWAYNAFDCMPTEWRRRSC
jgi:micrococcal nuclease